ncbi:hypothetical protein pb186bvf_018306 [Paramecium bursaria]
MFNLIEQLIEYLIEYPNQLQCYNSMILIKQNQFLQDHKLFMQSP